MISVNGTEPFIYDIVNDPFRAISGADRRSAPPADGVPTSVERRNGSDRRGKQRRRVLKKAVIILKSMGSTMNCLVRDISESGARLAMPFSAELPETFTLLLATNKVLIDVERVRQSGNEIGVKFIGEPIYTPTALNY